MKFRQIFRVFSIELVKNLLIFPNFKKDFLDSEKVEIKKLEDVMTNFKNDLLHIEEVLRSWKNKSSAVRSGSSSHTTSLLARKWQTSLKSDLSGRAFTKTEYCIRIFTFFTMDKLTPGLGRDM